MDLGLQMSHVLTVVYNKVMDSVVIFLLPLSNIPYKVNDLAFCTIRKFECNSSLTVFLTFRHVQKTASISAPTAGSAFLINRFDY